MPADAPPPTGFRRSLPNILTVARVLIAGAFFASLTPWRYAASPALRGEGTDPWLLGAAFLFILAALTDALDGHLARRWNVVSIFGRVMDPFADKLLVIGGFVFLAGPGFWLPLDGGRTAVASHVTPWIVTIILGRELLVTSIRAVVESGGGSFAASWSGKLKMILQSVCIPGVLVLLALPRADPGRAGWQGTLVLVLVWATAAITVWSGIPYVVRAAAVLRPAQTKGAPDA